MIRLRVLLPALLVLLLAAPASAQAPPPSFEGCKDCTRAIGNAIAKPCGART